MATPIPEGMYRAKLRWRVAGDSEEIICTLGLRNNEPGERDLNDVAHAVWAAFRGAFSADMTLNAYSFVGVDIDEGAADGVTNQGTWNEVLIGLDPTAPLPHNSALLMKKKSASAGRRNSGRCFLPPAYCGEGAVSATGILTNGALQDIQEMCTSFYDNLRDSTATLPDPATSFQPVILHSEPIAGGGAPGATDITAFVLDPQIATQRQRMRR